MARLEYAPNMLRALNGIFCIFKPQGVSMKGVRSGLKEKLTNGNLLHDYSKTHILFSQCGVNGKNVL